MARASGQVICEVRLEDGSWTDITPLVTSWSIRHGTRFEASPERPVAFPAAGTLTTLGENWQSDPLAQTGLQAIRFILTFGGFQQEIIWQGRREAPRVTDERAGTSLWALSDTNESQMAQVIEVSQADQGRSMKSFLLDRSVWSDVPPPELAGVDDSVLMSVFNETQIANRIFGQLALMLGGVHGHRKDGTVVIAGLNPIMPTLNPLPFILYNLRSKTAINHIRNEISFSFQALRDGVPVSRSRGATSYTASNNSGFGNDISVSLDVQVDEGFDITGIEAELVADFQYSAGTTTRTVSYEVQVPVETTQTKARVVTATASGSTRSAASSALDAAIARLTQDPSVSSSQVGAKKFTAVTETVRVPKTSSVTRNQTVTGRGRLSAIAESNFRSAVRIIANQSDVTSATVVSGPNTSFRNGEYIAVGTVKVTRTVTTFTDQTRVVRYLGSATVALTETTVVTTYRTETRTREVTNTERRNRRVGSVSVSPTVTETASGRTIAATFEIPSAWKGREVFTDAGGFSVPPASGDVWGTSRGQLIRITLRPTIRYILARQAVGELEISSPDSVARWGRRRMAMPAWFAGEERTVTDRVQAQLDRASVARQQHVVTFPVSQETITESLQAVNIDALTYIDLTYQDISAGLENISVVALVMERHLSWSSTGPLVCELVCVETGAAPADISAGTPRRLEGEAIDDISVRLEWERGPGGVPMAYTVRYRQSGSTAWTEQESLTTSAVVTGLVASTDYEFQVKADSSDWTATVVVSTTAVMTPGVPTNVSVTVVGRNATVHWSPPVDGGRVTAYQAQWRQTGTTTWSIINAQAMTNVAISGLTPGRDWDFQVRSVGPGGNSAWSDTVNAQTEFGSVSWGYTHQSPTTVLLNWSPVPGASSYDIEWRLPDADSWMSATQAPDGSNDVFHQISGLMEETEYEVRVRAVSAQETGPWDTQTITTAISLSPPTFTLSKHPLEPGTEIRLEFDSVFGAEGYTAQIRVRGTVDWANVALALQPRPHFNDIENLVAGTTYEVRMRSQSLGDVSDWSEPKAITTQGVATFVETEDGSFLLSEDGSMIELEESPSA